MDMFKIVNGAYHVKVGTQYRVRSNFTFKLKWEVYHPLDTGYVLELTREDNVTGSAFFKTSDICTNKEFMIALNRTFCHGGLLCNFRPQEIFLIVSAMQRDLRMEPQYKKTALTVAGLQQDSDYFVLNQDQIFNVLTGEMVQPDVCPIAWLPEFQLKNMPREDTMHFIEEPTSIQPLKEFINLAEGILGDNISPALLAWSSMYGTNNYQWVVEHFRNFNLPILYGDPMAGKTLIASCAAWLNGCTDTQIASRCTLAFITHWLTVSTMPFVWDDPSTPEDVAQLAVDLGGRAIRGKSTDEPKPPQTGCLVTANFDLSHLLRFFSRILIIHVPNTDTNKVPGKGKELEDAAKNASASFPAVIKLVKEIRPQEVFNKATEVQGQLQADLRIVQGIAYPLVVTEKILALIGRVDLLTKVVDYLQDHLYPYYRNHLDNLTKPTTAQGNEELDAIDVEALSLIDSAIVKGMALAIKKEAIEHLWIGNQEIENILRRTGALFNKTTRINGRPTKCVLIPKTLFSEKKWQEIIIGVTGAEENDVPRPVQQVAPAVHQLDVPPPAQQHYVHPPAQQPNEDPIPVPVNQPAQQVFPAVHQFDVPPPAQQPDVHPPAQQPTVQPPAQVPEVPPVPAAQQPLAPLAGENQAVLPEVRPVVQKDKCHSCGKKGTPFLLWIQCDDCQHWFHKKCTDLSTAMYRQLEKDNRQWKCGTCK